MIREHAFNTEWWGGRAGLVEDAAAFVAAPAKTRDAALAEFEWVELRMPLATAPAAAIAQAGFFQIDTQIRFRIDCSCVPMTDSLRTLEVRRAADAPFAIDAAAIPPFPHERFRHIPGATDERLTDRYATWARHELASSPEWSVEVRAAGAVQGWFLSEMTPSGLDLALAMLHREATISGMHLYQRCLVEYARLGARVGFARFSVENTPVMNIYARLGAVFLAPLGVWLWTRR